MISAVAAFALALLLTSIATPLVRSFAVQRGVVDAPGGRRVHAQVTPRLGGVAVMIGFFAPLGLFAVLRTGAMIGLLERRDLILGLVLGSAVVGLVGAVDDVRSLGPRSKLLAQALAALVAYAFGYRIEVINIPLLGDLDMELFALPVTVLWFLAITNAINLIDGLDGLATGIALFATFSNFALGYMNGSSVVLLLSGALAGSLLGFLRYNFNPATIFLGDSGSMFLGFTLAATSLVGATTKSSTAVVILVPIIALGVPILDTLVAMIRRALAGQSIFTADRGHIHHRLLDLGFTHRRVVFSLYGLSVALAFAAVATAFGRSWHVGAALTLLGLILFSVVRSAKSVTHALTGEVSASARKFAAAVRECVAAFNATSDESAVRQALKILVDQDVGLQGDLVIGSPVSTSSELQSLVYDVGVSGRARSLRLELAPELNLREPVVAASVSALVDACREALEVAHLKGPSTGSALRAATVHSGNSDK